MFAIVSFIIMPPLWGCIGYLIVWLYCIVSFSVLMHNIFYAGKDKTFFERKI